MIPREKSLIFISYRREDSAGITGRIYDRLIQRFGRESIFKDVDAVPLGVNFKKHLDSVVKQCEVVLVVIGDRWLQMTDKTGKRRLDSPNDYVRIEVESALQRDIPVIPLLVQGVAMPAEGDLPETLQELSYRNGITIGNDPHFHDDVDRLIRHLERTLKTKQKEQAPAPEPASEQQLTKLLGRYWPHLILALALAALALFIIKPGTSKSTQNRNDQVEKPSTDNEIIAGGGTNGSTGQIQSTPSSGITQTPTPAPELNLKGNWMGEIWKVDPTINLRERFSLKIDSHAGNISDSTLVFSGCVAGASILVDRSMRQIAIGPIGYPRDQNPYIECSSTNRFFWSALTLTGSLSADAQSMSGTIKFATSSIVPPESEQWRWTLKKQ